MIKGIRGYLAFAPAIYRVMAFLIAPCLLIAVRLCFWFTVDTYEEFGWLLEIVITYCYITFEIASDYWLFGGILSRDVGQPLLLRTSGRGLELLRKSFIWDLVRRFVWIMAYSLIAFCVTGNERELITGLLAYVVIAASLNLSRHVQNPQYLMMSAQPGVFVFAFLRVIGIAFEEVLGGPIYVIEAVFFGIAAVGVSVLTTWHMMHFVQMGADARMRE